MIPVAKELDLKKAAKVVGEKSVEMLKLKDLLHTVGYVHGGCSPIGMKKNFQTTIHSTAQDFVPKLLLLLYPKLHLYQHTNNDYI